MSDDGNVENNIRAELQDPMAENEMSGGQADNHGIFSYRIEESLAENMYNLSMEADISDDDDDDDDLTPTPSSRPPPEPFGINNYSEDDPSEMENMTTFAVINHLINPNLMDYSDVRLLINTVHPGFLKYGTVLAELEKWSFTTEDYLEENDFSSPEDESSYSP